MEQSIVKNIPNLSGYNASSDGYIIDEKRDKIIFGYNSRGYKHIQINGIKYLVHRLIALTFIPIPDNLKYLPFGKIFINHKDENPSNNNISNLEWCDCKYNSNYGTRNDKISSKLSKPIICFNVKGVDLIFKFDPLNYTMKG